jgi:DNA polymerase-3 subunit gamma/tau
MTYVVLARKWRPQTFEDVIGQEHVVKTLSNAIESGRVAHGFLFTGARGVGKTTAARLLAKALCCESGGPRPEPCNTCQACRDITSGASMDVLEIDGASNTGVDDVRELRENARYLPQRLRLKIFIIDEVHMLSGNAFNALLKLLEEPPPHLKFIFATTEPHKIPITILSRCQRYDFRRIPVKLMVDRLRVVCTAEGITVEDAALEMVSRAAEGGMRDALSLLDQVLSYVGGGQSITAENCVAALGLLERKTVVGLTEAILGRDGQEALRLVRWAAERGYALKELGQAVLAELRHLAVAQVCKDPAQLLELAPADVADIVTRAAKHPAEDVHRVFSALAQRVEAMARWADPLLAMEMAVMALCLSPPAKSLQDVSDLVARLSLAASGTPAAPPAAKGTTGPFERGAPGASGPPAPVSPPPSRAPAPPAPAPPPGPDNPPGPGPHPAFLRVMETLRDGHPALVSFLDQARARVEGTRLVLRLPQTFYVDVVQQAGHRSALQEATRQVLGPQATVEVLGPSAPDGGGESLAEARDRENAATKDRREREAREHPDVKLALEVFGGRIREVRGAGDS